jgi:hypothetical protein
MKGVLVQQERMMDTAPLPEGHAILMILDDAFEEGMTANLWRVIGVCAKHDHGSLVRALPLLGLLREYRAEFFGVVYTIHLLCPLRSPL